MFQQSVTVCVLIVMVQLVHPTESLPYDPTNWAFNYCTGWFSESQQLTGLQCSFNHEMAATQDLLPPIRTLILEGIHCTQDKHVTQWVVTRLSRPDMLQKLLIRNCYGVSINKTDLNPLSNLRELNISHGSLNFLHRKGFASLRRLQSLSLKRLRLGNIPNALIGISPFNQTDMWLQGLQSLDLSSNGLLEIPPLNLPNLITLDLSSNRLEVLHVEQFQYLERLQILNVKLNSIRFLPNNGFEGVLPNLQALTMQSAAILDLRQNSFSSLTNLRILDLSWSPINNINPMALKGLDSLEEINFLFNPLKSVPPELLQPVNKTLRKINLSECKLETIPPGFFNNLSNLQEVDLSKNDISSLDNLSFTDSPKLTILNLAFNSISNIPLHYFKQTPLIESIHLESNTITWLQNRTFSNLDNLKVVNLTNNKLISVSKRAFFNLPSLKTIDLSSNFLIRLPSQSLYLIPTLEELNLANNRLANFQWLQFVNPSAMNAAKNPHAAFDVDMQNNKLQCNCEMYNLISDYTYKSIFWPGSSLLANQRLNSYQELQCTWPPPLHDLTINDAITEGLFFQTSRFFCPSACQCYTRCPDWINIALCSSANLTAVPQNLSADTHVINLANNKLKNLPDGIFSHMKNLLEINLSQNQISKIGHTFAGLRKLNQIFLSENNISGVFEEELKNLSNLQYLNLRANSISTIELSFSRFQKLKHLFLDHNKLTTLDYSVLNSTSLTELTLNSNPFICNCRLLWLKEWLQNETNTLGRITDVNCTTLSNQTQMIVYVEDSEFACRTSDTPAVALTPHDSVVKLVAVFLGVIVLLMSIFAAAFRFRRTIQVVVYNRTGLRLPNKTDADSVRTYLYDAFVSFSSEDAAFVANELVPKMENQQPPFKLCIHHRDFLVGENISTNIVNAIGTSRRTIIVLSNNFVTSDWCSYEFKAAHGQLLKDHSNRLIVILIEEVDRRTLDKDLKLFLSTKTYLDRQDPLFWEKLRYAMPDKKRIDLMEEQQNDDIENDVHVHGEVELLEDQQHLIK